MSRTYGTLLAVLNYVVFWREQTDFARMFFELRCAKVLINDPRDEVIADLASLKTGVSRILVQKLREEGEDDRSVADVEAESLEHLGSPLTSPLVRHLVTQEKRQYHLLNAQFTRALVSNTLPFAIREYKALPLLKQTDESLESIIARFSREVEEITQFPSKDLDKIKEAEGVDDRILEKLIFPDSCYYCLPTLDTKELN